MLTFTQWKEQQVLKDSKENNVHRFYRERDWYYSEYGKYCNSIRKQKEKK